MALIALLALTLVIVRYRSHSDASGQKEMDSKEQKSETAIELPYLTDKKRLEIESLLTYSGENPDGSGEECEDLGMLQIKNCSDQYLEQAELTVELTDGGKLSFAAQDIPAGQTVLALETDDQSYDGQTEIKAIRATASYAADRSLRGDVLAITVDDAGIHLTNTGDSVLTNLTVVYHCYLNEMYFGGSSYQGTVESLAPGAETILETPECYLGEAAVVTVKN